MAFLSAAMLAALHGAQQGKVDFCTMTMHSYYDHMRRAKRNSSHKVNSRHQEIRQQKEAKCRQDSVRKGDRKGEDVRIIERGDCSTAPRWVKSTGAISVKPTPKWCAAFAEGP